MSAQPTFVDRTEYEQGRYDRARTSRGRAALLRSVGEPATGELDLDLAPDDELSQLVADFGHTTDAANILLQEYEDFSDPMARFVNGVIGLAGGRVDWFEAPDERIAERICRTTKTIQTVRKKLLAWQATHRISVIDVCDSVWDGEDGGQPHKYRVRLSRLAAEATLDARTSHEWVANPGKALEEAAANLRTMLPMPEHRKRKPSRKDDAETLINRKLKHIGTLIDRVEEIREATGGHVELNLATVEDLKRRIEILEQSVRDPLSTTLKKEAVEMRAVRRFAAPVHPDLRDLPPDESPVSPIEETAAPEAFFEGGGSSPGGGGSFLPVPSLDRTESTTCDDSTLETDENSETPTQTYMRLAGQIYDREDARGKTRNEAAGAVQVEIGEFDDWLARMESYGSRAVSHTCPSPDVDSDLIAERVAVMCEGSDVSETEAAQIARRDLCEVCAEAAKIARSHVTEFEYAPGKFM